MSFTRIPTGERGFLSGHDISYFKDGYFSSIDYYDYEDRAHFFIQNTLFAVDSVGRINVYQDGKKTSIALSLQKFCQPLQEKRV